MRAWAYIILGVMLSGCGEPPSPRLAADIWISSGLSELVSDLDIYVLGPKRTDGIQLVCTSLMARNLDDRIAPDDPKVERLGHEKVAFGAEIGTVSLDEIAAGTRRLVYVGALDADGEIVGEGCEDDVTVQSGTAAAVNVGVNAYGGPL